jgi:hypothetical protein
MTNTKATILLAATLGLASFQMHAAEIFVVRVQTISNLSALDIGLCDRVFWKDTIVFHNDGSNEATIRLLSVSNGGIFRPPGVAPVVPAGQTFAGPNDWQSASESAVWVNKLDVPDGVNVKSRVEAFRYGCGAIQPSADPELGAFSLPVFDHLAPAGSRQIHLGADIGSQPSVVNVGFYNDADVDATAVLEIHQVCDDSIRESQTVIVPGKTLVQLSGIGRNGTDCTATPDGSPLNHWMRYVVVTMDQPGLSYVVNRSFAIPTPDPVIPYAAP